MMYFWRQSKRGIIEGKELEKELREIYKWVFLRGSKNEKEMRGNNAGLSLVGTK